MRFVILIVLAFLTSLDSFGVGVAFGLSGTRVRLKAHAIISLVMLAITAGSVALGNRMAHIMPERVGHYVDALFFVGVGVGMLVPLLSALRKGRFGSCGEDSEDPHYLQAAKSSCEVCPGQALALGFMLSINNVGGGISAGLIELDPMAMAVVSVLFNVLLLAFGHSMGACVRRTPIKNWVQVFAGTAMVAFGIYQLC